MAGQTTDGMEIRIERKSRTRRISPTFKNPFGREYKSLICKMNRELGAVCHCQQLCPRRIGFSLSHAIIVCIYGEIIRNSISLTFAV